MNPELDHLDVDNQAQAVQQEPAVKLDLLVNDVNLILAALQELPHKVADPLLRKIMEQANAQLAPNGA
ncbi:hypothetical protein UFOVP714_56 [uncultured Caudovirales phage]|uniref:Uncharacterized protein n=1 Tax=uncultured Caudovirales phage TaxID=2100421 RepID=A0A6J5P6P3_9CAUD|nr:hypothetical protein UFOVP714_56 [uncultured Caudovirales phage]CAB4167163.1 hypothetical protein UFOVP864_4 [uncultured Caudovirales phage]